MRSQTPGKKYELKNLPLPVLFLGIQYICLNLGQAFHLGPINLSWFSTILLVGGYFYCNHGIIRLPSNRVIRNICFVFLLWAVYAWLQVFFVKDFGLFVSFYVILITNIITILMTLLLINSKEAFFYALNAFAFSFVLNVLAAGIEFFTGKHFVQYNTSYRNEVVGFIGNYNDFCTFLFLGIVVLFICFFYTDRKSLKIFYFLCISASVFFIFFNGARGAIYSLYVLLLFWILLLLLRKIYKKEKKYNRALLIFSIIVLIFASIWIYKFGFYRALALLDNSGGGDIRSDQSRVILIKSGMEKMIQSFGFGIGAGQSVLLYGINLHNFYAEIFSEYGVGFGLFSVYLSFIVFVRKRNHINQKIDSLIQAAGFAFLIANVTSSSVNKMRALWIYLMIVVLIKETSLVSEENYIGMGL